MNPLNKIGNVEEMLKAGMKAVNDKKISHYDNIEKLGRLLIDSIDALNVSVVELNETGRCRNKILAKIYNELGNK